MLDDLESAFGINDGVIMLPTGEDEKVAADADRISRATGWLAFYVELPARAKADDAALLRGSSSWSSRPHKNS